jgi:radical SAM superfamily enzyme YgiQ (UPF0313 family)
MNNLDILLVNPFSWVRDGRPAYLPYGVLYLASYLRERGVSVDIFDANVSLKNPLEVIKEKKPKILGLSVLTGPVIAEALKISREAKELFPEIKIIWGGLHPTLFPEHVLKEPCVDFIIQAEGEQPLYQLIGSLLKNELDTTLASLGYKDKGEISINPISSEFIDLNLSPMPAWDLVDVKKYTANRFFASRVLTVNTSRGCPFKCAFCFNQGLPFQRWRALSAAKIYEQLMYLKDTYGINGIQFYEDSFDTDKNRVKEFCRRMIDNKVRLNWSHFSNVAYSNQEILAIEKEANCKYVEYGVESGSSRILKMVNKKQTVEEIKQAFDVCCRVGIKSAALFMIGYPSETMEELRETVDLVEGLTAHILICTIYRPYPATPLHDYCAKIKNFSVPDSLEKQAEFYRFSHMDDANANMSEVPTKYLVRLQKSFYAKFAIKELLLCLKEFNFGLLIYYLKQQVKPKAFLYTLKSLLTRLSLRIKGRE